MRESKLTSVLALLLVLGLGVAASDAEAKKKKRFGIEGEVVSYDDEAQVLTVKVRETKVEGRFASGNTVGGKAPRDIKRNEKAQFAIEPTGSVLRRTVVKGLTGGGLDTEGTPEGFKKALSVIPAERIVAMSFEENDSAAVEKGAPKYKLLLIQIQATEEELRAHFERISVEE